MDLEALAERVTERLWLLTLDQVKEDEMTAKVLVQEQSSDIVRRKSRETPAAEGRRESELYEMVKLLREEVAELRKGQNNPPERIVKGRSSYRKGCRACQEKGEEDRCEHCFRCGVVGHAARGCRAPKNPAEGRSDVKISVHSMRPDSSTSILSYCDPQEKTQELLRQRIKQLEAELEQRGKTEHIGEPHWS
ncbi:unnamed protein product [Leuciscus chuanchicus]